MLWNVLVTKQTGPVSNYMGHLVTITSGGRGALASKIDPMKIAYASVAKIPVVIGGEGHKLNVLEGCGV